MRSPRGTSQGMKHDRNRATARLAPRHDGHRSGTRGGIQSLVRGRAFTRSGELLRLPHRSPVVAVEGGPKYLALYDLENRHVLASPEYRKIYDPPTAWTRRMRPHFRNAVRNVYIDITAGVRAAENARGSALLLVMADITPALDEEFNRWYDEEHVPERLSIPGFLGGRRFKAVEGEPRYLALYDLKSVDVLASEPYRYFRGAGETAWTRNMLKAMQNFRRGVYASLPSPALTKCERR
jgi:hypothetical protein